MHNLSTPTILDLAEFQQLTKSRIVAVADLELKATKCAIIRLIVDCTVFLAKASVISDCRLTSQEQQQINLCTTTALTVNPFQQITADCDCNNGTMIPNALGLPHTLASPSTPLESWTSSSFQQLISILFLHSKDAYNNAITANITAQRLANLIHEHQLEQTTEATAIEFDKEPIIDSATINSLIAPQVKEATRHLCRELANAQSQGKKQNKRGQQKRIQTQPDKTTGTCKGHHSSYKDLPHQSQPDCTISAKKPRFVKKEIINSNQIHTTSLIFKKASRPTSRCLRQRFSTKSDRKQKVIIHQERKTSTRQIVESNQEITDSNISTYGLIANPCKKINHNTTI